MPTQQNVTLSAKGLFTFPNYLGSVPDGALLTASNVVIDRDNVINPRRGFYLYGTSFGTPSDVSKQLMVYKGRILRHWSTQVEYDSDGSGTFIPFNDTTGSVASVTETDNGVRLKYIESNGNLYFTSSTGIRKISSLNTAGLSSAVISYAGGVKALDGTATLNSTPGWFTQDSQVAYRDLWGIKDANSNVIEGEPSQRIVISNPMLTLNITDYNNLISNLATTAVISTFTLICSTNSTTTVTVTTGNTNNLSVGMTVTGTGCGSATNYFTIAAITDSTHFIMNQAATATGSGVTLTFGQLLHNTDYNSGKISVNSSSEILDDSLQALASKLDNDMILKMTGALSGSKSITANTAANPTVITSAAHGFNNGDIITISGSNSTPLINGTYTITVLDVNTFTIPVVVSVAGTAGTFSLTGGITSLSTTSNLSVGMIVSGTNVPSGAAITRIYNTTTIVISPAPTGSVTNLTLQNVTFTNITVPSSNTDSTQDLLSWQVYYDSIIDNLNTTTGISNYAKSQISSGVFSNSTQSATVNLRITIPQGVTTSHFYQFYRGDLAVSSGPININDVTPDDELRLIYEANPTPTDLINGYITFTDNIPESLRINGDNLYTNANSGQGILQANAIPPLAKDIAFYLGTTFYSNTQTKQSQQIGLLSVTSLPSGYFTIATGSTYNTYTFVQNAYQIISITSIAGNLFTASGTSDYVDIYNANNVITYRIWFQVGTSIAPSGTGVTLIECAVLNADTAAQTAVKLQYALTSVNDFSVDVSSNILTVTNTSVGITNTPVEHVANAGFLVSVSTAGNGESVSNKYIGVSILPTPGQAVAETAQSLVRIVNQNSSEKVYAFYVSGPNDLPGLIYFEARSLSVGVFYLTTNNSTIASKFNPSLGTIFPITSNTLANPTVVTSASHGLTTGNTIVISGSNSTPIIDGIYTITRIDANTFSIPVNVTIAGTSGGWINTTLSQISTNEVNPNRLYYSKAQQPEAVPTVNYFDVGSKDNAILRVLPLRSSVFILTQGGVYILTGTDPTTFQLNPFDYSITLKAIDSAVVLNNEIFCVTGQGVTMISDGGSDVISRAIEDKIVPLFTSPYTAFSTATFAIPYESDRAYLLGTIVNSTDTQATIIYRYNYFTKSWVSWDMEKTCGVVNPAQDLLYLGAGDIDYIEQERKTFSRTDIADREYILTIPTGGVNGDVLSLGGLFQTEVGDVLVQTQYLSIDQLNRLLKNLDSDTALQFGQYYNTFKASAGSNLRNILTDLANQLDLDAGLASHTYAADISGFGTSFSDTQDAFNVIVANLIADANTHLKNYLGSTGTLSYEVPVVEIISSSISIITQFACPFIAGPIVLYKSIDSMVEWCPHYFGDPSMLKHVSESTLLFDTQNFTSAFASYATDLSPSLTPITITGEGTGLWGNFVWGNIIWGGLGTSVPFRTLVPWDKQRCRYIKVQWEHSYAREKYGLYGISLTFRPVSNRGYR